MSNVLANVMTGEIERAVAVLEPMWDAVPAPVDEVPTARVMPFANRLAAGRRLGAALRHYARTDAIVLGITQGGIAVAHGIAQELDLKLDCWLVRELISALEPGLVLGVIAEGPSLQLDRVSRARSGMTDNQLRALVRHTAEQMALDARLFRAGQPATSVAGRTVILVDDGITSGSLLSAASDGVSRRFASKVVIAAPVGTEAAVASVAAEVHESVCLMMPPRLRRVGAWYQDFRPVSDVAAMRLLASMAAA